MFFCYSVSLQKVSRNCNPVQYYVLICTGIKLRFRSLLCRKCYIFVFTFQHSGNLICYWQLVVNNDMPIELHCPYYLVVIVAADMWPGYVYFVF